MEETKKITIEDLAWDLYQSSSLVRWEKDKYTKETFHTHDKYDVFMKSVRYYINQGKIPEFKKSKPPKKEYPIIKVTANGHPDWYEGARTWCFVYSKNDGNFILEGFRGEVEQFLKRNFTHYFCYWSMWSCGQSRGYWRFWKEKDVSISMPSKHRKEWKYTIEKREFMPFINGRVNTSNLKKTTFIMKFKRMPKQWIKEFNKL